MRKGITTLFSTAVELEMLGTWYLCRFMVVAPISRVFAFLVVQSLNHHYDDPVSTAKGIPTSLQYCVTIYSQFLFTFRIGEEVIRVYSKT